MFDPFQLGSKFAFLRIKTLSELRRLVQQLEGAQLKTFQSLQEKKETSGREGLFIVGVYRRINCHDIYRSRNN